MVENQKRAPSSTIKAAAAAGVHKNKKKPMKRNKKRHSFLKKVVTYLITDSYMYAPLLSSRPSSPKQISLTAGVEAELGLYGENKKKKKKKLIEKVTDFLKSDCYMYAPLLVPQQSVWSDISNKAAPRQTGQAPSRQKAAATHWVGKFAEETRPPTPTKEKEGKNIREEDKQLDRFSPARTVLRKRVAYSETAKHMVHLNCRSSSVPGALHETESKKLLVE